MTLESQTPPLVPSGESKERRKNKEWRSLIPPESGIKTVIQIIKNFNRQPQAGEKALYEPQKQVVADVATALLYSHGPNGYIELPTGAGKTMVAATFLQSIHRDGIVAVPTNEIKRQFRAEFERMGAKTYSNRMHRALLPKEVKDSGTTAEHNISRQGQDARATPISATPLPHEFAEDESDKSFLLELPNGKRILITTHDSLRTDSIAPIAKIINQDAPRMLIVDEGHMAIGEKTRDALAQFLENPKWMVLAMSATPEYSEASVGFADHSLAEYIGPCFHRISIQEAIDAGLIAPFRMSEMEVGLRADTPMVGMKGRSIGKERIRQVNAEYLKSSVVELLKHALLSGKKVIIHCNTIGLAQEIQQKIAQGDSERTVLHINGEMTDEARGEICHQFNTSAHGVLIGAKLVGTGLDLSDVGAAIVVGNTESKVKMMQAFGRALRIIPGRESEVKELIHIRSPLDNSDTVKYIKELRDSGHIAPFTPEYDQVTGEMLYRNTNIAEIRGRDPGMEYSAVLNARGEVLPNAKWQARAVPPEYVAWSTVLGRPERADQETQLTILAVALSENPNLKDRIIISKQETHSSNDSDWGLWLDPQTVSDFEKVRKRMEDYGISGEYVTAAEIARRLKFDRDIIVNFIRDNQNIQEIQQFVLGLVPRTKDGELLHFGFVTEMYPRSILENPYLPRRLDREELQNPNWFSVMRLESGDYTNLFGGEITRLVFTSFVKRYLAQHPEAQSLVRLSSVIGSRDPPEYQYHIDLVREYKQYMDEEYRLRTQSYTSIRQLKIEMGIFEHEVREYISSEAQAGDKSDMPPLRRFAIMGHDPYGEHIRNDLLVGLIHWIVNRREVFKNQEYLRNIVRYIVQTSTSNTVDEEVLSSVLEYYRDADRKKARQRERDARKKRATRAGETENMPSAMRELVDAIVVEYNNRMDKTPNHTPLE